MSNTRSRSLITPCGMSLLELMAAVAIIATLATLALTRVESSLDTARRDACHLNRAEIELQARLWLRAQGAWPAADLSDIGDETDYFPEGVPTCPLTGATYTIDASTGEVVGHDH